MLSYSIAPTGANVDLTRETVTLIRLGQDSHKALLPVLGFAPMVVRKNTTLQVKFRVGSNWIYKVQTVLVPWNISKGLAGDFSQFAGKTVDVIFTGWTQEGKLQLQVRPMLP